MPKKNVYIAVAVGLAVVAIFLLLGLFDITGMTSTPTMTTPTENAQALLAEIAQTGSVASLQIITTSEGEGEGAKNNDMVSVHYTGVLPDGTVFDSSRTRGAPIEFALGTGYVIKGWDQGLLGMKVGERRLLAVPGDLAYGPVGRPGSIPPNAILIFDVEMIAITPAQ